jgi:hypothetical protein
MKKMISIPALDDAPFPFHIKDKNHRWVYVNKGFLSLLQTNSVLGKSENDFFQDWQVKIFREQDLKAMKGEVVTNLEPVGEEKFAITTKFPFGSEDQIFIGGITIFYSKDAVRLGQLIDQIPVSGKII